MWDETRNNVNVDGLKCKCSVCVRLNQGVCFLNCGSNVADSLGSTITEIHTSVDLVGKTVEGREKKIGQIVNHLNSYRYKSIISRP